MQRLDILSRPNAEYIDTLFEQYQNDPHSVDEVWQAYFAGFEAGGGGAAEYGAETNLRTLGIQNLVHSYRELGHFVANLDPLGKARPPVPLLDLKQFGMTDADLDRVVGKADFRGETDGTLRDLVAKLQATYCRTIGVEYMGISDKSQREWLAERHGTHS